MNSETVDVDESPDLKTDLKQQEPQSTSESPVEAGSEGIVGGDENQDTAEEGDGHSLKSATFEAEFSDTEFGEGAWPSTGAAAASSAENPDPFSVHEDPFSSQEGQSPYSVDRFETAFGSDPFVQEGEEDLFSGGAEFGERLETEDSQKLEPINDDNNNEDSAPADKPLSDGLSTNRETVSQEAYQPDVNDQASTLFISDPFSVQEDPFSSQEEQVDRFETAFGSDPFVQGGAEDPFSGGAESSERLETEDSQKLEPTEDNDSDEDPAPADKPLPGGLSTNRDTVLQEADQPDVTDQFGSSFVSNQPVVEEEKSEVDKAHSEDDPQELRSKEEDLSEAKEDTSNAHVGDSEEVETVEPPAERKVTEDPPSLNRRASSGASRTDSDYSDDGGSENSYQNQTLNEHLGTGEDESRFWDSVISIDEVDIGPIESLDFDSDHFNSANSIDQGGNSIDNSPIRGLSQSLFWSFLRPFFELA